MSILSAAIDDLNNKQPIRFNIKGRAIKKNKDNNIDHQLKMYVFEVMWFECVGGLSTMKNSVMVNRVTDKACTHVLDSARTLLNQVGVKNLTPCSFNIARHFFLSSCPAHKPKTMKHKTNSENMDANKLFPALLAQNIAVAIIAKMLTR